MITNPAVGKSYWIIIDLWETELPAPVVLISDDGGTFTARWHLGEGCTWENESVCIFLDDTLLIGDFVS